MKTFDSVKLMRQIRDQLSREMAEMSPKDRLQFIQDRVSANRFANRLRHAQQNSVRQENSTDSA